MMGRGHKRAASDSSAITVSKMGCFRAFTADSFRESYKGRLVDQSLRRVYITHQWSSITSSLELPEALLLSTVKDQLLANDYVLQPFGVGSQPSIQIWEIFKHLLALQAGEGEGEGDGRVCLAAALGGGDMFEWSYSDDSDDDDDTELGYGEGDNASGRSEFVLVRAPANRWRPNMDGLNLVTEGATPLLVGEVKPAEKFRDHIWQPLSRALELMDKCSAPPESMWVFVTDAERWEFVRVDRVPCSGTGEGAAAAGGAVAGGSSAGPRYSFTRFQTLSTSIADPTAHYLKLLAVLHHILFPGQRLADLPDRIAHSRQALEARAKAWVDTAQKKFQRDMEEMEALKAEYTALKAEYTEQKAHHAALKAEHTELKATSAKLEASLAERRRGTEQADGA